MSQEIQTFSKLQPPFFATNKYLSIKSQEQLMISISVGTYQKLEFFAQKS